LDAPLNQLKYNVLSGIMLPQSKDALHPVAPRALWNAVPH